MFGRVIEAGGRPRTRCDVGEEAVRDVRGVAEEQHAVGGRWWC